MLVELVEDDGRKVNLMFMEVGCNPEFITLDGLHAILRDRLDMKLCAMAWDGTKLYYPPLDRDDILNKRLPLTLSEDAIEMMQTYGKYGFSFYIM